MNVISTKFEGLFILEPAVFGDDRGYFFESFNTKKFENEQLNYNFVQDNISYSEYGVIRGLHFQTGKFAQAKLVQVLQGKVLDVAVDLRAESATFKQIFTIELSSENKKQLLIPRGFAHGFSVLSKTAMFNYKCDNFYNKEFESGIDILDETLNIDWQIPTEKQIIAERDLNFQTLEEFLAEKV